MTQISESEDPESLLNLETDDTPPLTQESENKSALSNPDDVLNSVSNRKNIGNKISAPNYKDDMLNSQVKEERGNMDSGRMKGGALYRALLDLLSYSKTRSTKPKRGKQTRKASRG